MSNEPRVARRPLPAPLRSTVQAIVLWRVRWKLRGVCARISALERQLAGEFATLDTAPMHQELTQLRARRSDLESRIPSHS